MRTLKRENIKEFLRDLNQGESKQQGDGKGKEAGLLLSK